MSDIIKNARRELGRLCKDPSSFLMHIPARQTDMDLVFAKAFNYAEKLEKENAKLREALEFYANGNSHYNSKCEWGLKHLKESGQETVPSGEKAREALDG